MARLMKDSGIPWIGEIPVDWEIERIGRLYDERREKVSDLDYAPLSVTMRGVLPQLSTAAKTDAHDDRKLVRKGDFAINSRSDRRGSCGISPYDGSVSLINTILIPRREMHPVFYEWLFHSSMFSDEFYKWGHGIVDDLWTTNWQDMKKIFVPLPPIEIQSRIANFLDAECARIDAIIEQTRATVEEYKKLKQSIITQAVTKGIRPNRPMKDSGIEWIGEIPEEWRTIKFKYLHKGLNTGEGIDKEYWTNDESNIVFYTAGLEPIRTNYKDFPNWKYTKDTDLLLARNGTPYVYSPDEGACYTDHIIRAAVMETVNRTFVQYCLSQSIRSVVVEGVSLPTWSASLWNEQVIPWPSANEQLQISSFLDAKCARINTIVEKKTTFLEELLNYKKSLIYEYVTGKKEALL